MYIILVYDIRVDEKGQKILNKVFKVCKRYLCHIQSSVFEGELSESQLFKLKTELSKYLRKNKDSCIIFRGRNNVWMKKEFLTNDVDKTTQFL